MVGAVVPSVVAFLAGARTDTNICAAFALTASQHPGFNRVRRSNVLSNPPPATSQPRTRGSRLCMHDFSSSAYWNQVYTSGKDGSGQDAVVEWHVDGGVMAGAVQDLLGDPSCAAKDAAILNVGCGTSSLWKSIPIPDADLVRLVPSNKSSLYDRGWRDITNIDFSSPCIEQGRRSQSSRSRPGVRWIVMDACDLAFDDSSFDLAVDKGTLDAIACSEAFDWFIPRMARSVARVLRPGGIWVCVSFTPPELVLPLLEECDGWVLNVERLQTFWMYVGRKRDAGALNPSCRPPE